MNFFKRLHIVFISLFSFFITACEEKDEISENLSVTTRSQAGLANGGYTFVEIGAQKDWTLSIDFMGLEEWATLTMTSGTGENNGVILSYDRNESDEQRSLNLILKGAKNTVSCTFVQLAAVVNVEVTPDPVAKWMELPSVDNEDLLFFTHHQTIRSAKMRSFSYHWDVENLVAHWIAYPLNSELIGSGSRTDEWGLDPKLPRNMQPVLFKGYRGGYDRGHQLPSADRLNRAANVQTFYGTNMTPQMGRLNQEGWAALEGAVRDWSRQFDTLYVVTGCIVDDAVDKKVAYDNDNKAVAVPDAYYKALLGYKRDASLASSTAGYMAIGFYYPHEAYSGGYMAKSMTIDELEKKTGLNFFVNLPAAVGDVCADKIESTKENWWN